jgi:hypothetical protein
MLLSNLLNVHLALVQSTGIPDQSFPSANPDIFSNFLLDFEMSHVLELTTRATYVHTRRPTRHVYEVGSTLVYYLQLLRRSYANCAFQLSGRNPSLSPNTREVGDSDTDLKPRHPLFRGVVVTAYGRLC